MIIILYTQNNFHSKPSTIHVHQWIHKDTGEEFYVYVSLGNKVYLHLILPREYSGTILRIL